MHNFLAFFTVISLVRSLPIGDDEIQVANSILAADWNTAEYQNLPLADDTIIVYESNPSPPPNYYNQPVVSQSGNLDERNYYNQPVVGQLRNFAEPTVDKMPVNNLVIFDQPDNVALVDTVVLVDDQVAPGGNRVPIVEHIAFVDNVPINENIPYLNNLPKYVPDPNQRPIIYKLDANPNGNERLRVLPYQTLLRRRRQTIKFPSFRLPISILS